MAARLEPGADGADAATRAARGGFDCEQAVEPDLAAIDRVCVALRRWLTARAGHHETFVAELLGREMLTNAVRHGCTGAPGERVSWHARWRDGELTLTVADQGPGFDPAAHWQRLDDPLPTSGRGLPLLRQYARELAFDATGNRVTVRLDCAGKETGMPSFELERQEQAAVIRLAGDLVASVAEQLKPEVKELLAEGVTELTVDMTESLAIDSVGIGLLVQVQNSLQRRGSRLKVCGLSADCLELFRVMRLDRHFDLSSD